MTPFSSSLKSKGSALAESGPISSIGLALFIVCALLGGIVTMALNHPAPLFAGGFIGLYFMFAIKVADQWEKAAVLRLGRYRGLFGPGAFHIIPIVDSISRVVDQRVRVTGVSAESTLTRDTVPTDVDAIVFWIVWNAEKCVLEVQNFQDAVMMSAQTALRESIGRHELAQMITDREMMGRELQRILDEKTNPWGITVQSVEIRDVKIPQALEDDVARGASGAGAAGAGHSGHGRDGDFQQVRRCSGVVQGQPHRTAPAGDEHAVRGDQGERRDGDRTVHCGGDDGTRRTAGHNGTRRANQVGRLAMRILVGLLSLFSRLLAFTNLV